VREPHFLNKATKDDNYNMKIRLLGFIWVAMPQSPVPYYTLFITRVRRIKLVYCDKLTLLAYLSKITLAIRFYGIFLRHSGYRRV
jgi:hypothetical protein